MSKPTCAVGGQLASYSAAGTGTCTCSQLAAGNTCAAEFRCEHQREPEPPKTCLGCGAKQQPDGSLTCGH